MKEKYSMKEESRDNKCTLENRETFANIWDLGLSYKRWEDIV
jgi:hypothetical protein